MDDIITIMERNKINSSSKYVILGKDMSNYTQVLSLKRDLSSRKGFSREPTMII